MKKFSLFLLLTPLYFSGFSQVMIYNLANPYKQDFDSLSNTGTSSILPAGWLFAESGTGANTTYAADNGSSNSGNTYSYGATGSTERAFGTLLSGSVTSTIGAYFSNNSGSTITSITINYFGEEWRLGVAGRADTLKFQYSTNATSLTSGTFINVDSLDFDTPNTNATVGVIDGNAAGNRLQKSYTITGLSIAFRHREVQSNLLPQKQVNRLAGDCFAKLRKAHNNDTFARTKFRHREVRTRLRHREVRSDLLRKNSLMNFKVNFFDRLRKARNNATFSRTKFRHR